MGQLKEAKQILKYDMVADRYIKRKSSFLMLNESDYIYVFKKYLRYSEYYDRYKENKILFKIKSIIFRLKYRKISIKLGYNIPLNVCGKGLSLPHIGNIVINSKAVLGDNCRILPGVTIGATSGCDLAPVLGDNVYVGTGAKILGGISIADCITVGANSVVVNSFTEPGITIAGIPAKQISDNDSSANLVCATIGKMSEKIL